MDSTVTDARPLAGIGSSERTLAALVAVLAVLAAVNLYLPQVIDIGDAALPFPRIVAAIVSGISTALIYGALGWAGVRLARRVDIPEMWAPAVSSRERFVWPAVFGVAAGVALIAADLAFSEANGIGPAPHPPFPTSMVASAAAGIGEEIVFRLFLVPLIAWLLMFLAPLRGRTAIAFWFAASVSAVAFALGHIPSLLVILGLSDMAGLSAVLIVQILLMNGLIALLAAWWFLRAGFLAAVGLHFWTDIVWHVLWGGLTG